MRPLAGLLATGLSIPAFAQSVPFPTYSTGAQSNGLFEAPTMKRMLMSSLWRGIRASPMSQRDAHSSTCSRLPAPRNATRLRTYWVIADAHAVA